MKLELDIDSTDTNVSENPRQASRMTNTCRCSCCATEVVCSSAQRFREKVKRNFKLRCSRRACVSAFLVSWCRRELAMATPACAENACREKTQK